MALVLHTAGTLPLLERVLYDAADVAEGWARILERDSNEELLRKVIKPQGLFLLHTIGNSVDDRNQDPWFEKYVFPGACIPGPQTFFQPGCIGDGWKLEDWHNFGVDYKRTCQAWWDNSIAARGELPAGKYDDRFWRMWEYYLQGSAAGFAARSIHLWQFVLSPQGLPDDFEGRGGYEREN